MSGFPRACFSEKELNATRWYAKKNGVSMQPTIKQVKNHCEDILNVAGLGTKLLDGKLGNCFAVNDWFKILDHGKLEEVRQAAKWKREVDGKVSGPMARGNRGKDYYVEEVCFARLDDAGAISPVIPMRWFTCDGKLLSIAHPLHLTSSKSAFVIDGTDDACLEIPLDKYFLNVCDLEDADSQGRRVHSIPLWTYCDDTSGNVSKKWNKHNSILFTLAGLPRALMQMLYNIHFIAISNLSPPLEMIEAVTAMLREAGKDGIEVWDCEYKEWILIIPWFLAFQGDNPMSSEFASHIGMKGKFFCRVCQAKSDKNNHAPGHAGEIDRLKEFMTLKHAIGAPSAVDDMATDSGSKDKYFHHFLEKLQAAASKLRDEQKERDPGPSEAGISKAEELHAEMPDNIFNPVLSILKPPDFDANADTPVEILHVILLGVVKYWWRDAVSRQNSKGKEELKARLSSVNVAGLKTPPIRGNTYVQYAGSLEKLNTAVSDFLNATALWNTQWFNKPKFHFFESFNLVIRLRSIHSTKHAPSLDIATAFSHLHAIRHLVNGNSIAPRQAGPEVLALLNDEEFLGSMSMDRLRDVSKSILPNGDKAEILRYIIYRKNGKSCVGRVEEILAESETDILLGVLVSACTIGPDILPYRLPACTVHVNQCSMIVFEVSPSIAWKYFSSPSCKITLTRQVIQELQQTEHFENEVNHAVEPDDCFLNLAQLRSATDVQKFRSSGRLSDLSLIETIEQSIHNCEQLERETKEAEEAREAERLGKTAGKQTKEAERLEKVAEKQARKRQAGPAQLDADLGSTQSGKEVGRKKPRRKKAEVDRDYAEGGDELEYVARPSKLHTAQP
ncbi:hypothetical protein B0H17DRAFT_1156769 [Mycena rosella]|uniref:Uncharacterized protein n=1 Tax=Mycena rosella TaxID=1033263 RepID=A0AAD7GU72_MYCRO|nr:hypothetical protein B0H17DRAFT_1156769 [Mycena rosella]